MAFPAENHGETTLGDKLFHWGLRTYVMGVINFTSDSFSGDGLIGNIESAVQRAFEFQEWGADIIDVGGESTRPASLYTGYESVSMKDELSRVIPLIGAIADRLSIPISIDTYKARVADEALSAGASMVNDVWGLQRDPDMASIVSQRSVPVVITHNNESSRHGSDVVDGVIDDLRRAMDSALRSGISMENIIVDPGIGFGGKTPEDNLDIIRRLHELQILERPVLIGTSRKSTIGYVLGLPVGQRIEGTAATVALSIAGGADIVRVHDVKEMMRVVRMSDAVVRGWKRI